MSLAKEARLSERSKHIDVKFHFIRDHIKKGTVILEYIPTDRMVADILTKALSRVKFETFRDLVGIC